MPRQELVLVPLMPEHSPTTIAIAGFRRYRVKPDIAQLLPNCSSGQNSWESRSLQSRQSVDYDLEAD